MNRFKNKKLQRLNKKIPGDHIVRFYYDKKSGHPFMSISLYKIIVYGHEMTTHPSRKENGLPRNGYVRFRKNPNPSSKEKSYYHRSIKRIENKEKHGRLSYKKSWVISKRDLRRLKRIDQKKIKNVRCVNN